MRPVGPGGEGADPAAAEQCLAQFLAQREEPGAQDLERFLEDLEPNLAAEVGPLARLCLAAEEALEGRAGPSEAVDPSNARYRVEGELGRGGMGRVYGVWDAQLDRRLAMKVLPPGAAASTRRRFIAEAKLAGGLEHPGVVAVHELGETPEGPWFTMARVEGDTFSAGIARARAGQNGWNLARATQVLLRVCEAVGYAHSRSIVHRDLKPQNVMLGAFGETYVMDWGLARRIGERPDPKDRTTPDPAQASGSETERSQGLTRVGDVVGTPGYMPPEQARGDGVLAPTQDVYAIGAMLYELLVGHPPHLAPDQDSSPRAVLARSRELRPPSITSVAPRAPAELVAIAERAMARDPAARYPEALALGEDLRAFLEGRVVRAYESGGLAELKKWIQRNRRLAWALLAVFVAVMLGTAATFYVQGRERSRALRFYDLQLIAEARAEADQELWPETPERIPAFETWLARAEPLRERLPRHRAQLEALDRQAALDRERPRRAADGQLLGYTFDDLDQRWRHERLRELVEELSLFFGPEGAFESVKSRLAWASGLVARTVAGPAEAWAAATQRVRGDPRFDGLALAPQLGLLPLGPNPASGLEEFAFARSGPAPVRDPAGLLSYSADSALVLVLLPGGEFLLGVDDDPMSLGAEGPRQPVRLAPFLIGKQELTQAQWRALGGEGLPFFAGPLHERWPMESVSWGEANTLLTHHGLCLPTEAQWEFAALGGSPERFPWGADPEQLFERAVLDSETPLPVGSLPAEQFGLFDLLGNVSEWCQDPLGSYLDPVGGPAALRIPAAEQADRRRMVRGGYHSLGLSPEGRELTLRLARPRSRISPPGETRSEHRGLRAAALLRAATSSAR